MTDLSHIPATGILKGWLRALATSTKRVRPVTELEPVSLVASGVVLDADHIARYAAVCGFARFDPVPLTYPQMLTFPLVMHHLTTPAFPWPALGTVHLANAITQHQPLAAGERVRVELHSGELRSHDKGQVFTLDLRILREETQTCVWQATQTLLRVGVTPPVGAPFELELDTDLPLIRRGEFDAPADIGRRYASVSGDHNPIHLWPITARLLGFRRSIAHGLWTQARALAMLQPDGVWPQASLRTAFKRPLFLPARASVWQAESADSTCWFEVRDALGQVPHLRAHLTRTPQTPMP